VSVAILLVLVLVLRRRFLRDQQTDDDNDHEDEEDWNTTLNRYPALPSPASTPQAAKRDVSHTSRPAGSVRVAIEPVGQLLFLDKAADLSSQRGKH
jgi:hypothetical protein